MIVEDIVLNEYHTAVLISEDSVWDLLAQINEAKISLVESLQHKRVCPETVELWLSELVAIATYIVGNRSSRNYVECKTKLGIIARRINSFEHMH